MTETPALASVDHITGWFPREDQALFAAVLADQAGGAAADLVEIGAYQGKSAALIGQFVRPGDRFVVIDPFGDQSLMGAEDPADKTPGRNYYTNLTRQQFEENYLSVNPELPVVVQALSNVITDHVAAESARFIHVDGSHQYADVAEDTRSVKQLLRKQDGVVVFDDWRKANCPGVAAAVWDAVLHDGVVPVALTNQKMYAVYEGAERLREVLHQAIAADGRWLVREIECVGQPVLRVTPNAPAKKAPAAKKAAAPAPAPAQPSVLDRVKRRLRG